MQAHCAGEGGVVAVAEVFCCEGEGFGEGGAEFEEVVWGEGWGGRVEGAEEVAEEVGEGVEG